MDNNTKLYRNEFANQFADRRSPVQQGSGKRYMPGLDGLRALSVIAVIAYHLNWKWAQGGLLGVGIFFVISGYLITDQIIYEWTTHQRLSLLDFWMRRARRLLPAMISMLLFVALGLFLADSSRLLALKGDFLSSLVYVNNWWLIFHDVSYFETFGPPSPIGHLWSLSIEEQFYVIWPLVLVIGLKLVPQRSKLTLLILTCAGVSALVMAIIYVPGTDPSRVYYGTDTRAFALLVGAALAVIWPSQKLKDTVSTAARNMLDLVGGIALIVLIMFIWQTNEYDDSLYPGGLLLVSFIAAVVIAVLAHPSSLIGKIMGCKPLRWIGVRSYSLYIWHYPVIILTSPDGNVKHAGMAGVILQLTASMILSALSYKYIEEPWRHGKVRLHRHHHSSSARRRLIRPVALTAILMVILIPVAFSSYWAKPEPPAHAIEADGLQKASDLHEVEPSRQNETAGGRIEDQQQAKNQPKVPTASANARPTTPPESSIPLSEDTQSGKDITAIGDSVILDAAPFLEKMLPGIVVDGKVGRQMWQAQDVVDQLKAQGKLGKRIIIELGTNGAFRSDQLRSLLQSLEDAEQIILVNTRVPRKWQDTVNTDLAEVSNDFSNATVVDWYSASEGKDDFFYRDGVHLMRDGAEYYASILAKAVTGKEL